MKKLVLGVAGRSVESRDGTGSLAGLPNVSERARHQRRLRDAIVEAAPTVSNVHPHQAQIETRRALTIAGYFEHRISARPQRRSAGNSLQDPQRKRGGEISCGNAQATTFRDTSPEGDAATVTFDGGTSRWKTVPFRILADARPNKHQTRLHRENEATSPGKMLVYSL